MTIKTKRIRAMIEAGQSTEEIVAALKVKRATVYGVRYYDKKKGLPVKKVSVWKRIKNFLGVK